MPQNVIKHVQQMDTLPKLQERLAKKYPDTLIYLPDLLKEYPWDLVLNYPWDKIYGNYYITGRLKAVQFISSTSDNDPVTVINKIKQTKEFFEKLVKLNVLTVGASRNEYSYTPVLPQIWQNNLKDTIERTLVNYATSNNIYSIAFSNCLIKQKLLKDPNIQLFNLEAEKAYKFAYQQNKSLLQIYWDLKKNASIKMDAQIKNAYNTIKSNLTNDSYYDTGRWFRSESIDLAYFLNLKHQSILDLSDELQNYPQIITYPDFLKMTADLDMDRLFLDQHFKPVSLGFCKMDQTIKFKTDDFALAFNNYQQITIPKNQVFESDTILCLTNPVTYKHNLYLYDKKTQNYYFIMRAYV